ncbi:tail fiber domain-containing protein, partial [Candidatus Falkowbacteria bacterium]|nr:tail fiber domain-containing protein [Candidatus Falkowbacteria bacterium]
RNIEIFSSDSDNSTRNIVNFGGRQGGTSYAATEIRFTTAPNSSTQGGTTRMLIDNNGNVGVGTSTPGEKLHVYGSGAQRIQVESSDANTAAFKMKTPASEYGFFASGALDRFSIYNYNSTSYPLVILGDGNVGIGTTNPEAILHINDISSNNRIRFQKSGTEWIDFNDGSFNDVQIEFMTDGNKYVSLGVDDTDDSFKISHAGTLETNTAFTINTSGNVGIGTSTPAYKLEVVGTSGIGAAAFVNNSDINLKFNIRKIDNALEKIKSLEGVYFDWKADGSNSVGLIAQDVEKIFPELVTGKDGQKGVQYSNLVAPLIEAIKEQQIQIDDLRKKSDFRFIGSGINYSPSTGSHGVILSQDFPSEFRKGMIVSVTGEAKKRYNNKLKITSTLATVKLSTTKEDKTVYGIIESELNEGVNSWYQTNPGERFAIINTIGQGKVLVTNMNGSIEAGDYITSSSIPGYGMRQADDILRNYTVAKAIEKVDWNKVTETIEWQGNTYKVYLLGVVYNSR